jgi:hypothetical protein
MLEDMTIRIPSASVTQIVSAEGYAGDKITVFWLLDRLYLKIQEI